jgi:hypothetical protein
MAYIDQLDIPHPCSASWAAMAGDDRTRFCNLCSTTVYNASELSTCELERMLAKPKPPCLRVTRDSTGRVLTRDRIAALAFLGMTACMGVPAEPAETIPEVGSVGSTTEVVAVGPQGAAGGAAVIPEAGEGPTTAGGQHPYGVTVGKPVVGDVVRPRVIMGVPEETPPVRGAGGPHATVRSGDPDQLERPTMGRPAPAPAPRPR